MNDKIIFSQSENPQSNFDFKPKQEFSESEITVDSEALNSETLEGELLTEKFEETLNPKPRWWKKLLVASIILFLGATVAQSIQWLIDTWQNHQWIYFVFALVSFFVVVLGLSALIQEWRHLVNLRRHMDLQQQSEHLIEKSAVNSQENFQLQDSESGKQLCLKIASAVNIDEQAPTFIQWEKQVNDSYSAQEVAYLFSQEVLKPIDSKVTKLITASAIEAGTIVTISPLALVDMFFIAWRNIRLVNKIAKIYGIQLGYFSRLRLMRLILVNIAFTGATELIQEIGMDWLSRDIAAKLSARAAQGIGVGLLTARLGIKTMEFCRPLKFRKSEKPKLSHIHRELLGSLKSSVFSLSKMKDKENV
ncbi:TIGR01620 family protein [Mannheimia massilioguelmaensis]|uniref:TIGR01620 family protein n=1 Tax=Mannheimia massilioguelmaensis TaxID=1604354 RepID=UPI0005C97B7D|nr:TIGR01620 family protein [Mannheimia massilioguelmaensis]